MNALIIVLGILVLVFNKKNYKNTLIGIKDKNHLQHANGFIFKIYVYSYACSSFTNTPAAV